MQREDGSYKTIPMQQITCMKQTAPDRKMLLMPKYLGLDFISYPRSPYALLTSTTCFPTPSLPLPLAVTASANPLCNEITKVT